MLKRKPYIAFLILLIATAGASWAVWIVGRYMLYNPIERIRFDDLPPEATQEARFDFTPLNSAFVKSNKPLNPSIIPSGIPWPPQRDAAFAFITEHEAGFFAKAQTISAFDPVTDEHLQNALRDLMKIRSDDESERLALAITIYKMFGDEVKDSFFRQALYDYLTQETLLSSMDNPDAYPLRLAEVKSEFYDSKMKEASQIIERGNIDFDSNIKVKIGELKKSQDSEAMKKILEIRDYLLEKTSTIKQDSFNDTGGGD